MSIIYQVGGNLLMLVLAIVMAQWVTKGFLFKYIRVFASRGKLLLVEINHPVQNYMVVGWIEETFVRFFDTTTRNKKNKDSAKKIPLKKDAIKRWLGVNRCIVDEELSFFVIVKDGSVVSTWDPNRINNLFIRALSEPKKQIDMNLIKICLIVCVIAAILSAVSFYNLMGLKDTIAILSESVKNIGVPVIP